MLMPAASSVITGVVFTTLTLSALGFSRGGFSVNHMDIAPKYAGMVMGISNTAGEIYAGMVVGRSNTSGKIYVGMVVGISKTAGENICEARVMVLGISNTAENAIESRSMVLGISNTASKILALNPA